MLEPWNDSSLLPPPVHTTTCDKNLDIKELAHICDNVIKVLSKQSPLHRESAIISRFLYKFDKKFRNDIGYRNLKKVNTALHKYLVLNLIKDIENFIAVLPNDEEDIYLPTRQMLEYVLIRLITFSKIMLRICVCSKQAAVFYLDRIKRGDSYWMSLMPYALLSRMWSMSMVLLHHSCRWYKYLLPWLEKLKLKGLEFLPAGFSLPLDLDEWLDVKNLDCFGRYEWSRKKLIKIDSGFEDADEDMFDSILDYVNQINEESPEDNMQLKTLTGNLKDAEYLEVSAVRNVDQGEAISRASFKTMYNTFHVKKKMNHSVERVTNKDTLHQFIITEEELRNDCNSQSLTSQLSFMQWQALKHSLLKLHDSLSSNRKIERKFQKIWKEKCIDCGNDE